MAFMDTPVIGSGTLLCGKDGKLLVQGDDKVVSSNPNESHRLVTQQNADGTSSVFVVPSEGVNKGKFFLVMPQDQDKRQKFNDILSSNITSTSPALSETFSNSSETIQEKPGSQSMSNVLKNIANHISSVSSTAADNKTPKSVEKPPTSSTSLSDMSTGINVPTSSGSSYLMTGVSENVKQSPECESKTNQKDHDTNTNLVAPAVQPNVTLGASGTTGNKSTIEPFLKTKPGPLYCPPALPNSAQVIIIPSGNTSLIQMRKDGVPFGNIPVLPMRTGGEQPLLAALNAPYVQPLVEQTSKTPAFTTYYHKPNILMKTTPLQPSTLTTNVSSCQTTITTASNCQSLTSTGVSEHVPLVPVIINTNQTNTSASNFLPNAATLIPTSSQSLPLLPKPMSNTSTSAAFVQASLTTVSTSSQPVPLQPVTIAPKPSQITLSNFQQAPVTNSPLILSAQQAATLLGMQSVPGSKLSSNNSFMKTVNNVRGSYSVNAVKVLTSSEESALRVTPAAGLSTVSHSSGPTTTTTFSTLTRPNSEVTGVATSVQDGKTTTPALESVNDNPVLNSDKQERSNDQVLASVDCSATTSEETAISVEDTITMVKPIVTHPTVSGTCLSGDFGATPMLLFSHNAARNLKPNGLPDPCLKHESKEIPKTDATTTKPSLRDAISNESIPAHHQGLPSVLEVKSKEHTYTQIAEPTRNINSKKFTVVRVPLPKDSPLPPQRVNSPTVSLATCTSSYMSTSCNISSSSSSKAAKTATTEISSTLSDNVKSSPQHVNAKYFSSLLTPSSKTGFMCAGSTTCRLTNSSRVVTSCGKNEERKGSNQPMISKIIVNASSLLAKIKRDNNTMGNLVSIVPSNSTKKTTYQSMTSLLTTSGQGYTRVERTINGNNDVKNVSKPYLNLPRNAEKDTDTAKLTNTIRPISKMACTDDLPLRIDSVFSLSTGHQASKPESVVGVECVSGKTNSLNTIATEGLSNARKSASLSMKLSNNTSSLSTASNMDFEVGSLYQKEGSLNSSDGSRKGGSHAERSPTSSVPSVSQILREFDHLSNFCGVILPDEAITESKIFSPCYVVLETLHMHGGKMEGINTQCSRTCRQKFVSKKSNIRLAIQRKKHGFEQAEADCAAEVPAKAVGKKRKASMPTDKELSGPSNKSNVRLAIQRKKDDFEEMEADRAAEVLGKAVIKKRKAVMTSDNELPGSINHDGINVKRSREILHASLIKADNKKNGKEGKQITPPCLSLKGKDDTSERVKPTSSQAVPLAKKVPNREKFYLIRVDGKTVLIPYINAGSQPKAFIINEDKVTLGSYTVQKSSPPVSVSGLNEIVLPRVSTVSSSTAASSVGTSVITSSTKPAPVPTPLEVKVKPEPITYGYGDQSEADSQPPVIVKQERMDRGYSDEPPKLERMDAKQPKRTSGEMNSNEHTAPDLTAEQIVPPKIQKVLSKEERISSLKELLKKQEKDLEAIRKRRVAESTPVDLDF